MIERTAHVQAVRSLLRTFPAVAILGARQVGKTTLARRFLDRATSENYFDLEGQRDLARLREPFIALEALRGLVVLDEIQRRPDIFPALRVLADRPGTPARFLVLGSASPSLLRQTSETLAGRVAFHELPGFDLSEVGPNAWERLWLRGGFPRSFLARTEEDSRTWRGELVRTYLHRELPDLGMEVAPTAVARFWTMLSHYHGQTWNAAELARAFGASEKTMTRYLDLLCATFLARRLRPFHANVEKREVKSPKVYLSDTGILHTILGIRSRADLLGHPKAGASFEGLAISEVVHRLGARPEECFFWGVHTGAELDLLVVRGRRRLGFEVKFTDAPTPTASMRSALDVLRLDRIDVVHAGDHTFPLADGLRAVSLRRLRDDLPPLPLD